jgi:hypothetical protein
MQCGAAQIVHHIQLLGFKGFHPESEEIWGFNVI